MTTLTALSLAFREIAREKCNEDPHESKKIVMALKNWIKKAPHLKARCNERLLLAFLRRTQFNLEAAKHRIDAYYSYKNLFPEVLCERLVNDVLELNQMGVHIIPQHPISPTGPRLIISRFSKYNSKQYFPRHILKLFFMLLEILAVEDNNASISGVSYVVDARDVAMEQILQYDQFLLKKIWMLIHDGLPVKFNEVHIINMRREAESAYSFHHLTSFLPSKIPFKAFRYNHPKYMLQKCNQRDKADILHLLWLRQAFRYIVDPVFRDNLIVHRQAEDLYKYIPRDAMTIEYGGHNSFACEAAKIWSQKLKNFTDYFAEDDNFGTNEKLRSGLVNSSNVKEDLGSGTNGLFRKIDVD